MVNKLQLKEDLLREGEILLKKGSLSTTDLMLLAKALDSYIHNTTQDETIAQARELIANDVKSSVISDINTLIAVGLDSALKSLDLSFLVPIGSIFSTASQTLPNDYYLFCHGQKLLKADYEALYQVIGDSFGVSTDIEFFIPDTRGLFIRGYDAGVGADLSRVFGTVQPDAYKSHTHWSNLTRPAHLWDNGANANQFGYVSGGYSRQSSLIASGGTETRPKNLALNYIIKVK